MRRLTKAEKYRESFFQLGEIELVGRLDSEKSKDQFYALRALYRKNDLVETSFDMIKKTAEDGPTAGVRRMALNVLKKFFDSRLNEVDIHGKVISGSVYFLLNPKSRFVKIGFTTNFEKRLKSLSRIEEVELIELHRIRTSDYSQLEVEIHNQFGKYRSRGEWFDLPEEIVEKIRIGRIDL